MDSARWAIAGMGRSGSITWQGDGTFDADVTTEGIDRDLTITVSARLKDGGSGEDSITLRDRGKGPAVFIESPQPRYAYGSSVRVWGQVRGPVEAPVPFAEVASLAWSVPGTRLGGALPLARDGVFDFSFSTVGLRGDLTLTVVAADRNGHHTVAVLALSDRPGGPPLRLDSPRALAEYGDTVSVSGRVGDPADPSAAPAEVKSLTWR
ncbi:MAG TPA: hypothetical protein VMF68_15700, partial [Spirochaetia bacterium]|nr:hypothetical protein [Spirochaetia bacterium]